MKIWAAITVLAILSCFATLEFSHSDPPAQYAADPNRKSNFESDIALTENIHLKPSSFLSYVKKLKKHEKQRRKPKGRFLAHIKPYSKVAGSVKSKEDISGRSFSQSYRLQELNPNRLKQPTYIKQTKVPEVFQTNFPKLNSSFLPDRTPDPLFRLRGDGLQGLPIREDTTLNNQMSNLQPFRRPSASEIPLETGETIPHSNKFFASALKSEIPRLKVINQYQPPSMNSLRLNFQKDKVTLNPFIVTPLPIVKSISKAPTTRIPSKDGPSMVSEQLGLPVEEISQIKMKEQKLNQSFLSGLNYLDSPKSAQVTTFPSVLFSLNNQKTTVTTIQQSMNAPNAKPPENLTMLVEPQIGIANTAIVNLEGSSDNDIGPSKSKLPSPDTEGLNSKMKVFSSDGNNKRPFAIPTFNQDTNPFLKNATSQSENDFIEDIINTKFSFLQLLKLVFGGYQDNSVEISENDSLGYLYDGIWSIFIPLLAVAIIQPIVFLYLAAREVSIPVAPWVQSLAVAFNRNFPLRVKMVTRSTDQKKGIDNIKKMFEVYKQVIFSEDCLERMSCQLGDSVRDSYWKAWIFWLVEMFVPAKFGRAKLAFRKVTIGDWTMKECRLYRCDTG
ncbi:uncharacterized protein LOC136040653 [Artemia franciscana]